MVDFNTRELAPRSVANRTNLSVDPLQLTVLFVVGGCPDESLWIRDLLRESPEIASFVEWPDFGAAGSVRLARRHFDVVLVNFTTGESVAPELLCRIRQQFPGIPIVVLVPNEQTGRVIEACQSACQDWLTHAQVDRRRLHNSLRFAVERSRQPAQETRLRSAIEELRLARQIQKRLCGPSEVHLPGYEVAGAWFPAEQACGDFFDFVALGEDRLAIFVGDVCGHGLGPALLAAEARAYLRTLATTTEDVAEILTVANRLLAADMVGDRFVTAFFAQLQLATRRLEYFGAAQGAYRLRGDSIDFLDSNSGPMGLNVDGFRATTSTLALQSGDLVIIATDGLFDSMNPEGATFGTKRVLDSVFWHRREPAAQILNNLHREMCAFARGAPKSDDITVAILKVGGTQ